MKTRILDRSLYWELAMIVVTAFLFAGVALAADSTESRATATSQGKGIARGQLTDGKIEFTEHDALRTAGERARPGKLRTQQKGAVSQSGNVDFWFYDATVDLFGDIDGDGYYYGIDLTFDVDTLFAEADVYAVIYLSYDFGPWNEYAETDVFTVFGASGGDEYTVVSELVSGYPTGDYDILIELFDTFDGSIVASIGPDETSELSFLPLEDTGRDAPLETVVVINTESGGGSLGWFALLGLAGVAIKRRALAS